MTKKIFFNKEEGQEFKDVLKERVNAYFQEKNISIKANVAMYCKTTFYLLVIAALYALLLPNLLPAMLVYPVLGFVIAIGTMNISHDALHGAYFAGRFGNRLLGLLMDLFGASSFYWRKEHTVDHHTFTNIAEHDADLMVPSVLRLCPKTKHYWFHRFQFIYAPFLYCVNLIHWVYYSDIKRIFAVVKEEKRPPKREICFLILFKFVHIATFLVIPIIVLPIAWWMVLLGYLCFLFTIGITLTIIFQLAHIVEDVAFPLPDKEGKVELSFLQHQLATTSNFATKSWLATFMFGGLNFQVEHHIFPHICHIHLPKIAKIVKETAKEFGLAYHENETFIGAVLSHFRTLKRLGKKNLAPTFA